MQHFVPRFYLQSWADEHGKIWAYDKVQDEVRHLSTSKVAGQKWFYHERGEDQDLERAMSKLEAGASRVLKDISAREEVQGLSEADRRVLNLYASVQMLRTPTKRLEVQQAVDSIRAAIGDRAAPTLQQQLDALTGSNLHLSILRDAAVFVEHFDRLHLALEVNADDRALITSDHPLVFYNHFPQPQSGLSNLGLVSYGIQVLLPLSPRLELVFTDPRPWQAIGAIPTRIPMTESGRVFQRSQQCFNAQRFLYSSTNDFGWERKWLMEQPMGRDPNRPRVTT